MAGAFVHAAEVVFYFFSEKIIALTTAQAARFLEVIKGKAASWTAAVWLFVGGSFYLWHAFR